MRSVELFVGAGGLAMGIAKAGFSHDAVVEWDRNACNTIRVNQRRNVPIVAGWKVHQADVRKFDYESILDQIDLVAGGPPCQPFSLGGKHRGHEDRRDMFPQAVRAVRELRPRAFIFENVKGLLRQSFSSYLEYIWLQLSYPELGRLPTEKWEDHLAKLEQYHTAGRKDGLTYNVIFSLLNAADFGVPQRRERVFLVGFRSDLHAEWSFPRASHSQEALLWSQWVTGEYWDRHCIPRKDRPSLSHRLRTRVERLESSFIPPDQQAWLTVRDALRDLPDPEGVNYDLDVLNHELNPGARIYPGHTGSPLDEPAKTLKAGDHGVPGGENMLVRPDGSVRYFTIRESARLQTFPDDYVFAGSWTEIMRQLGNAVPVELAHAVARDVAKQLRP